MSARLKEKKVRYIFKKFDDLCEALKMVEADEISEASLYKYDNKFHLVNNIKSKKADLILREFCFEAREISGANVFLKEHAELICEGAGLISMAEGIKALD